MNRVTNGGLVMHPWTLYALEVMRDREREVRNNRFAADFREASLSAPERPSRSPSPTG